MIWWRSGKSCSGWIRARAASAPPVQFKVWEGGGEYNVGARFAPLLRPADGRRAPPLPTTKWGRLLEDFILQGGVDTRVHQMAPVRRRGRDDSQRTELHRARLRRARRGGHVRTVATPPPVQLKPGDFDWDIIFGKQGVRWLHTGGIFAALVRNDAALVDRSGPGGQTARHDCVL